MNINFDNLKMGEYFEPLTEKPDRSFVDVANKIERDAKIEDHPFFKKAKNSRDAMILWTSQEAIVTNPISETIVVNFITEQCQSPLLKHDREIQCYN